MYTSITFLSHLGGAYIFYIPVNAARTPMAMAVLIVRLDCQTYYRYIFTRYRISDE